MTLKKMWTSRSTGAWFEFDSEKEALEFEKEIKELFTKHGLTPFTNTFWNFPKNEFTILVAEEDKK